MDRLDPRAADDVILTLAAFAWVFVALAVVWSV